MDLHRLWLGALPVDMGQEQTPGLEQDPALCHELDPAVQVHLKRTTRESSRQHPGHWNTSLGPRDTVWMTGSQNPGLLLSREVSSPLGQALFHGPQAPHSWVSAALTVWGWIWCNVNGQAKLFPPAPHSHCAASEEIAGQGQLHETPAVLCSCKPCSHGRATWEGEGKGGFTPS